MCRVLRRMEGTESKEVQGYRGFGETKHAHVGITIAATATSDEMAGWETFSEQAKHARKESFCIDSDEVAAQPWISGSDVHSIRGRKHSPAITKKATFVLSSRLLRGTMAEVEEWTETQHWSIQFVDSCLRGVGQVFVINNPVTGLLILVGIGYASWYMLLLGILGLVSATGMANLLGFDSASVRAGLFGYNGILCGMALGLFHFGNKDHPAEEIQVILPVVFVGALSSVFTSALGKVTVSLLGIPPFTFPFQLASWIWLLGTRSSFSYFPSNLSPKLAGITIANGTIIAAPAAVAPISIRFVEYDHVLLFESIFTGISEVFLINDKICGAVMVLAIAISSPIAAGMATLGAAVGTLTAVSLGVAPEPMCVQPHTHVYRCCM